MDLVAGVVHTGVVHIDGKVQSDTERDRQTDRQQIDKETCTQTDKQIHRQNIKSSETNHHLWQVLRTSFGTNKFCGAFMQVPFA